MIYKIANKYYVNISSMIFSEVDLVVENETVVIKPLGKKIEINATTKVEQINLADEKTKILKNYNSKNVDTLEYRPSKNRRK